jgi:hypothetical protein
VNLQFVFRPVSLANQPTAHVGGRDLQNGDRGVTKR